MNLANKYNLTDTAVKFRLNKLELILATLAVNLLSLALPIMVLQVYDRIMLNHSKDTLIILSLAVCGAILLESIIRIIRSYATSWAGMVYEYNMDFNAIKSYINSDFSKKTPEKIGKQMQNLSSFAKMKDFYSGQALVSMVDIPFSVIFLMLIWYIAGSLVLIPIILIGIFTYTSWYLGKDLIHSLYSQDKHDDNKYNFIVESLQGIHSIKSYGLEENFRRKFEYLEEKSTISNYQVSLTSMKGYTYSGLLGEIMIVAVVAFGAPMVIGSNLTTGALIATVLLSGRLMQPIQKALFLWTQYQNYILSESKIQKLFSIPQMNRNPATKTTKKPAELVIKDVDFGYGSNILFKNINLTLKNSEIIAIHGKNNSGKSTLLRLIAGILPTSKGKITINGIKSENILSEDIVKHIGLIESDNIVFQGTIMENITAFDEHKEAKAIEMAKIMHLDKEIAALPQGYETKIIDGFVDNVSPGIKQKISIIRILLNNPKILLFNNADKGLDNEGYIYLIKLLESLKGKIAMIMVTEDSNIFKLASKHYVLENGSLEEADKKTNAIFKEKIYKELRI